jgi:two-component system NtrC family sensor kinase
MPRAFSSDERTRAEDPMAAIDRLQAEVDELRVDLSRSEALAELGTLVGLIAHEFNNLLTPIQGYADAALRCPDDETLTRRALERAADGSSRASAIAGAILELARDPHPRDPSAALGARCRVRETLEAAVRSAELELVDEVAIEGPADLEAGISEAALHQVVFNLLLNAKKAVGGGGGARVQGIRVLGERSTGNTVRIEVRDSGPGIPRDLLPVLFKPHVTRPVMGEPCGGARSTTPVRQGHGLGLALCKRLVEHAGGSIEVDSVLGEGTSFAIRLAG